MKGAEFRIPPEFKRGTATRIQAEAWTASLLSILKAKPNIKAQEIDFSQDGTNDLLLAEESNAGSGGNSYLAFERTPKGYRYIGTLDFAGIDVLPKDGTGVPKIILTWHMGAYQTDMSLIKLESKGFHGMSTASARWNPNSEDNYPTLEDLHAESPEAENILRSAYMARFASASQK